MLWLALTRLQDALDVIEHQEEVIDEKESFSLAAQELQATAAKLDGLPYATIVDTGYHRSLIKRGWTHRWNPEQLQKDVAEVEEATQALNDLIAAAEAQAASNGTGTFFETITDQLGTGYVSTSLDTADASCEEDVWGCVTGLEPFTIHYDHSQTAAEPFMTDWLRTGLAYHEYAHVLQYTNPRQTAEAVEAFGGDVETMADCYALTELPGWTLDHQIWDTEYSWWDVSVGYGYTCDESQRQVIRDWVAELGFTHEPISQ